MKYAAFLRGISSGMNPSQKMENLRAIFEELGFKNVSTVIASGNVIFESSSSSKETLEKKIEAALKKGTGIETSTIVWTEDELELLVKLNPFKGVKVTPKVRPHVTFTKDRSKKIKLSLPKPGKGYQFFGIHDGVICYSVDLSGATTPDIMRLLEKQLGKGITTRTWGTVEKIYSKMKGTNV
jgi:uncharacterized protein (DUF1697 family)